MLIKSIETVFIMIFLISTGWMMSHAGWLDSEAKRFLNKIIINVSVPAVTITNFFQTFPRDMLSSVPKYFGISSISILAMMAISWGVSKLLRIPNRKSGIFIALSSLNNCLFFGLPIAVSLFGDAGIPYILFYYITDSAIFWSVMVPKMMRDGGFKTKNLFAILKNVINVPMASMVLCAILLSFDFSPPSVILQISKYLGSMATPLAAIFVGRIMYEINLKDYRFDRDVLAAIMMRFLVAPAMMFFVAKGFGLEPLVVKVLVIMAAMPAKVQTSLVAEMYGTDSKYAAFTISFTTLLGLFFIPVYMLLLNFWV